MNYTLKIKKDIIDPTEYPAFRQFLAIIDKKESEKIGLKKLN